MKASVKWTIELVVHSSMLDMIRRGIDIVSDAHLSIITQAIELQITTKILQTTTLNTKKVLCSTTQDLCCCCVRMGWKLFLQKDYDKQRRHLDVKYS
jgi:hypothetical protein